MEIRDQEIEECKDLDTWEVIVDPQLPKAESEDSMKHIWLDGLDT